MELYEKNLKIRTELASWVDRFDWEMWFTGTFKPDRSYRDTIKTKRAFERVITDVAVEYKIPNIEYFMTVERFKHGDFTHVHALLNGLCDLKYQQFADAWRNRYGRCQVEGYQKDKGANFYLTKYVLKELCDWDLHVDKRKSHKLNFERPLSPEGRP